MINVGQVTNFTLSGLSVATYFWKIEANNGDIPTFSGILNINNYIVNQIIMIIVILFFFKKKEIIQF